MSSPQSKIESQKRKFLRNITVSEQSQKVSLERTIDAERMATFFLRRQDWAVRTVMIRDNFNLELFRPGEHIAAKIIIQDQRADLAQVEKFLGFLSNGRHQFTGGMCISTSGFTPSVYAYLRSEGITNLKLGILDNKKLVWNCEAKDREQENKRSTFIGVFTCKGGVGKTTISAHLAGALALNGYDVSLVDLDHQQNIYKLLGKGVQIPPMEG